MDHDPTAMHGPCTAILQTAYQQNTALTARIAASTRTITTFCSTVITPQSLAVHCRMHAIWRNHFLLTKLPRHSTIAAIKST
jgi:hypothetical protein